MYLVSELWYFYPEEGVSLAKAADGYTRRRNVFVAAIQGILTMPKAA